MARITERQQQEIKEIILDSYYLGEIDDIEDKSNLFDDLGFDDLDFVELVIDLENHFDITISYSDWENVKTVEMVFTAVDNCL